jgi:hypothetical protein
MHNVMAHLTNYSLNKRSKEFIHDWSSDGGNGSKRSLAGMADMLAGNDDVQMAPLEIWQSLRRLTATTMGALAPLFVEAAHHTALSAGMEKDAFTRGQCFQVFGFDVMLDRVGRPFLLEVNSNPSLSVDAVLPLPSLPLPRDAPTSKLTAVLTAVEGRDMRRRYERSALKTKVHTSEDEVAEEEYKVCRCMSSHEPHVHRTCPVDLAVKSAVLGGALALVMNLSASSSASSSTPSDKAGRRLNDDDTECGGTADESAAAADTCAVCGEAADMCDDAVSGGDDTDITDGITVDGRVEDGDQIDGYPTLLSAASVRSIPTPTGTSDALQFHEYVLEEMVMNSTVESKVGIEQPRGSKHLTDAESKCHHRGDRGAGSEDRMQSSWRSSYECVLGDGEGQYHDDSEENDQIRAGFTLLDEVRRTFEAMGGRSLRLFHFRKAVVRSGVLADTSSASSATIDTVFKQTMQRHPCAIMNLEVFLDALDAVARCVGRQRARCRTDEQVDRALTDRIFRELLEGLLQ